MKPNYRMTQKQLIKACRSCRFILLRGSWGYTMAVNTAIVPIALKRTKIEDRKKTDFVSYRPIDFHTYISKKGGFV